MASLSDKEIQRLSSLFSHERDLYRDGFSSIAGVDEAGRGPLAGPVLAAACIVPKDLFIEGLDDSKKLSQGKREQIFETLHLSSGVSFGIGIATVSEIDRFNILQASFLAMRRAILALPFPPDYLLIDGHLAPSFGIPCQPIVQGDSKSASIAAASILAKVTRDRIMCELDQELPLYGFKKNKGYGTEEHLFAIEKYGPSFAHRRSFNPVKTMLQEKLTQEELFL